MNQETRGSRPRSHSPATSEVPPSDDEFEGEEWWFEGDAVTPRASGPKEGGEGLSGKLDASSPLDSVVHGKEEVRGLAGVGEGGTVLRSTNLTATPQPAVEEDEVMEDVSMVNEPLSQPVTQAPPSDSTRDIFDPPSSPPLVIEAFDDDLREDKAVEERGETELFSSQSIRGPEEDRETTQTLENPHPAPGSATSTPSSSLPQIVLPPPIVIDTAQTMSPSLTPATVVAPPPVPTDPTPPRRTFRARKPEQLHPYMVELARHRQEFRQRGLKPVRVAGLPAPEADSQFTVPAEDVEDVVMEELLEEDDSQYVERDRVRRERVERMQRATGSKSPRGEDDEEDLPSPANVLKGDARVPMRTYKRRKTGDNVPKFIKPTKYDKIINAVHKELQQNRQQPSRDGGVTPVRSLPTPQMSSATTHVSTARRSLRILASSDNEEMQVTPRPRRQSREASHIHIPSSSSGSESESESQNDSTDREKAEREIEKLKRRLRGVLPPSFLKLDEKQKEAEAKAARERKAAAERVERSHGKGVAKRKTGTGLAGRLQAVFGGGEDSGDDDNVSVTTARLVVTAASRSAQTPRRVLPEPIVLDDDDSMMEEDIIDNMWVKPTQRRSTQSRKSGSGPKRSAPKKQFNKLQDHGFSRKSSKNEKSRHASHLSRGSKDVTQKRRRSRTPAFSIVDACARHIEETGRSPPPFMKIAKRVAAKRKDQGRTTLRGKQFRFTDGDEQESVLHVLRQWKEGRLSRPDWQDANATGTLSRPEVAKSVMENDLVQRRQVVVPARARQAQLPFHPLDDGIDSDQMEAHATVVDVGINRQEPGVRRPSPIPQPRLQKSMQPAQLEHESGEYAIRPRKFTQHHPRPQARLNNIEKVSKWLATASPAGPPDAMGPPAPPFVAGHPAMSTQATLPDHAIARAAAVVVVAPIPKRRVRKKVQAERRDIHQFDGMRLPKPDRGSTRFEPSVPVIAQDPATAISVRQLALNDYWFTNQTFSITFDVLPVKVGTRLDPTSFVGSGELHEALTAHCKPNDRSLSAGHVTFGDEVYDMYDSTASVAARFEIGFRFLVDSLLESRSELATEAEPFLRFVAKYIGTRLSMARSEEVATFGQALLRSVESALDRILTSVFADRVDYQLSAHRTGLQFLQFCLVWSYQLSRLSSHDSDCPISLGAERALDRFGRHLLQLLLTSGMNEVQNILRRLRSSNATSVAGDTLPLQLWLTVIHVFDDCQTFARGTLPAFWDLLNDILHVETKVEAAAGNEWRLRERAWFTIANICPLYQFSDLGVTGPPPGTSNWSYLVSLLNDFFGKGDLSLKAAALEPYYRALIGRCHTLVRQWNWKTSKDVLVLFYNFFSARGFAGVDEHDLHDFPMFLQRLDVNPSVEIDASDTSFHIFLKVVVLAFRQLQAIETPQAKKALRLLASRLTPLGDRRQQYASDKEFSIADFISLENHYALLITLYYATPEEVRPPIESMQDLVIIENAHCKARLVSVKAWSHVVRLRIARGEDLTESMGWLELILRKTAEEYRNIKRDTRLVAEGVAAWEASTRDRVVRFNLTQLENVMIVALKCVRGLVSTFCESKPEVMPCLLIKPTTSDIFASSFSQPDAVVLQALGLLRDVLQCSASTASLSAAVQAPLPEEDSQDYGDVSFLEEFAAVEAGVVPSEASALLKQVNEVWSPQLFQMLSNYFGADNEVSDNAIHDTVKTWLYCARLLVQHNLRTWVSYLEGGAEAWPRLGDVPRKRAVSNIFFSTVLECVPEIYHEHRMIFLSFWISSIVEPGLAVDQHVFTSTLLSIDTSGDLVSNPPFVRQLDGSYSISAEELRSARGALLSSILESMGKTDKEEMKSMYTALLATLFRALREHYAQLTVAKSSGDLTEYIALVQQVVGNVLQFCSTFVTERCLPDLVWFLNAEHFPQPPEHAAYDIQRLRVYAGQDITKGFVQDVIHDKIKTRCEDVLVACESDKPFIIFLAALLKEDEVRDVQLEYLRSLVVRAIICPYLRPEAVVYIPPMLGALREVYTGVLQSLHPSKSPDYLREVLVDIADILYHIQPWTSAILRRENMTVEGAVSKEILLRIARTYDLLEVVLRIVHWCSYHPACAEIISIIRDHVDGYFHAAWLVLNWWVKDDAMELHGFKPLSSEWTSIPVSSDHVIRSAYSRFWRSVNDNARDWKEDPLSTGIWRSSSSGRGSRTISLPPREFQQEASINGALFESVTAFLVTLSHCPLKGLCTDRYFRQICFIWREHTDRFSERTRVVMMELFGRMGEDGMPWRAMFGLEEEHDVASICI
ncbi:hypothetical protein SAICODRAFT_106627 [Saitoella complicata NRRL Y-17804]|uniref:Uncharacterized protein n=1 Tax=Saitoella complicata (strain BCRC 22490 / CBS 7301 / JCM 7358 / NBRC 10748 / NRRL Y-17804) TaxID=698492 RepID=A0A0E9NMZ1_SAICN|nr:uncharacterized protein SAICODRAFT_106627 [Saitoella complicata NRRL Y-17804]ODQ56307.1 hypothetical protein SAICODRAFT_106627 [Saitoella complicata NRRL Y-17804]GAO50790.1 hypothetical protein G7K_4911-t1 [Saitoella complicata NRRL Y-17804]